jgi:hypothetical protein
MYPNIPSNKLIRTMEEMSYQYQLDNKITKELVKITRTVIEQNNFTSQNQNYFQNTGLAMGAPSSAVLSEVYLQHIEHIEIIKIITQHNVLIISDMSMISSWYMMKTPHTYTRFI